MRRIAVCAVAALGAGAVVVTAAPAVAAPAPHPVRTITTGLDGPFGLQVTSARSLLVAENVSGEITRVSTRTGSKRVLVRNLPAPAGIGSRRGSLYVALSGPNEDGVPTPGRFAPTSVLKARSDGSHLRVLANLEKYELAHNPDRQVQFVNGKPVDALSNPFSVNVSKYGLLVADGGANDVLRVGRRSGKVSTFFAPPTAKIPACLRPGVQANPGTVGCDPVPTGIAVARGSIYVSTLGAEVPGAGRVYQLNPHNGRVRRVWTGLTAPTGIAVAPNGTIFVSHVLEGAPAGPPAPDFDPSTVGAITRISPSGKRTTAQVTMPTGLQYRNGSLYATSWSIASFLGIEHAGQVVKVDRRAFR
jgi:hypothetical protein